MGRPLNRSSPPSPFDFVRRRFRGWPQAQPLGGAGSWSSTGMASDSCESNEARMLQVRFVWLQKCEGSTLLLSQVAKISIQRQTEKHETSVDRVMEEEGYRHLESCGDGIFPALHLLLWMGFGAFSAGLGGDGR